MNAKTVEKLCKINSDFYQSHHVSFSATRSSPWPGWKRCLQHIEQILQGNQRSCSVFDLACGNLRFEVFLDVSFPKDNITYYAVDNCEEIIPPDISADYQSLDILEILQRGQSIGDFIGAPLCDLSVTFGFMHHIPLKSYREEVLSSLVGQTRRGGYVIASFWQFAKIASMEKKLQAVHERACQEMGLEGLEDNDYLLGWMGIPGAYRYCHSFTEAEIDQLIEAVGGSANLVSRFVSDGKTENQNTYLVLQV